MTLLFSPYESYFDKEGRPTLQGLQLLNAINGILTRQTLPSGGTAGQVLTKTTDDDYNADWA